VRSEDSGHEAAMRDLFDDLPHNTDWLNQIHEIHTENSQSRNMLKENEVTHCVNSSSVEGGENNVKKDQKGNALAFCKKCNKEFRSLGGFTLHCKMHETQRGNLLCPVCKICGQSCQTKAHLTRHLLKHSTHKNFVCTTCGKSYKHKKNLKHHTCLTKW